MVFCTVQQGEYEFLSLLSRVTILKNDIPPRKGQDSQCFLLPWASLRLCPGHPSDYARGIPQTMPGASLSLCPGHPSDYAQSIPQEDKTLTVPPSSGRYVSDCSCCEHVHSSIRKILGKFH